MRQLGHIVALGQLGAIRRTCWIALVHNGGASGVRFMLRAVYFWMGLLMARYLFRRRTVQVDLDRLRNAGL